MKVHLNKIVFSLIMILHISCKNVTISDKVDENHLVSDKEVYDFLEFRTVNESDVITKCKNENILDFIDENSDLKKLLSNEDILFIKKQCETEKKFILKSKYLDNKTIIDHKEVQMFEKESRNVDVFWKKFQDKYKVESYFSIGLPLFSLNKKTVIVKTEVIHKGGFGATGVQIYWKQSGKWKLYRNYTISIS